MLLSIPRLVYGRRITRDGPSTNAPSAPCRHPLSPPCLPIIRTEPGRTNLNGNRFLKDELVTKLGIVNGVQLEALLQEDRYHRAVVRILADDKQVPLERAAGLKGDDDDNYDSMEPTDFSHVSDQRWEAELELARREAEFVRARIEAGEPKTCVAGAQQCWTQNSLPGILESRELENDAPPPLVSDSESGSESDDYGCIRGDGGVPSGNVEKVNGCLTKQRGKNAKKGKRAKRATFPSGAGIALSSSAGASDAAPPPKAASGSDRQNRAEDGAATDCTFGGAAAASAVSVAASGATPAAAAAGAGVKADGIHQNQGRKLGDEVETGGNVADYGAIERWVEGVATGRVTARAAQLQRFFRGRIDKCGCLGLVSYRGSRRSLALSASLGVWLCVLVVYLSQSINLFLSPYVSGNDRRGCSLGALVSPVAVVVAGDCHRCCRRRLAMKAWKLIRRRY